MPNATSSLDTIFSEAIDLLDGAKRADYLARACGSDDALRRRVEALVSAHFRANGSFLEHFDADADSTAAFTPATNDAVGPEMGTAIGPYTLREQIGEGGMGLVFVAEQTQPVRRKVALKLIKPGMDSRQVVARFEAERQALALMDHPNIAKVFDGGATPTGRPYFVMELVRGLPITEYCDEALLSVPERLALFVQVCRAVQHAHQKGVIHRDIKPSNVLVTEIDGRPIPKVIDFGIAKATRAALTDRTLVTGFHQLVGTPLYMAPEQTGVSGGDVDTRADVYSLGVLLYELLTGTTPFDGQALRKAGFDEMLRIIREDEPDRPSRRVSTPAAAHSSTIAERRKLDPRRLVQLMRSDLDWVVMKCLEKDRNRRYDGAGFLSADVDRFLANEPVQARPPSAAYRAKKFARRNRAALATVAVLTVAVLTVVGSVGWGLRDKATRRAAAEQAVASALDDADDSERRGRWTDGRAAADRAVAVAGAYDDLRRQAERRRDDLALVLRLQQVRLEMATVRGEAFDNTLGDRLYAEAFLEYGLDVDTLSPEEVARRLPEGAVRQELVAGLDDWTQVRRTVRPADDLAWKRPLAAARAADPDPWRSQVRDAWVKRDWAALKRLADRTPIDQIHGSGVRLLQESLPAADAVAMLRKAQAERPGDFWLNHDLARRLNNLEPPQPGEAVAFYHAALALRPDNPGVLLNLGRAFHDLGRLDQAADAYERAIRLKPDYAGAFNNLAGVRKDQGRVDEAIAIYEAALRADPNAVTALRNLGSTLASQGKLTEGADLIRKAIELKPDYVVAHNALGDVLAEQGKLDEAVEAYEAAHRIKPDLPETLIRVGVTLTRQGKADEAIAAFSSALLLKPEEAGAHLGLSRLYLDRKEWADSGLAALEALRIRPRFAEAYCNLGHALQGLGRFRDALTAFRRGHEIGSKEPGWQYPTAKWVQDCEALGVATEVGCRISPILLSRFVSACRTEGVWKNELNPLQEDGPMALRNWLLSLSTQKTRRTPSRTRLGLRQLEAREVPASLLSALGVGSSTDGVNTAAFDVAADAAGNSYMTGRFSGTVDFDPSRTHPNDADILTARGSQDIFVSKHAPDGSLVWATRMGGDSADPLSVDVDEGKSISVKNGVVAVTGHMGGTGDFGSYTLVSAGERDGFVAKLDAATGTVGMAARWGTAGSDVGTGVDTDGAGNVYVLTLSPNYTVLKYSPSGNLVWSKFISNKSGSVAAGGDLAVDAAGNVYATGTFQGYADLNPGTGRKDVFSVSSQSSAGFALKLNTNGTFVWASPFVSRSVNGVVGFSSATSIALDGSGNMFVGGRYGGSVDFNPGTGTTSLPTAGGAFVTKLDSVGRLVWAQGLVHNVPTGPSTAPSDSAQVNGLATDASGNVYATGIFYGTVDFDPGVGTDIRQSVLRADGTRRNTDIFVVKLTGTGTLGWADTFGGTGYDYGYGVAVDPSGVVHVAGLYWSPSIAFDPDPLANSGLTKTGYNQWLFLVRLRQN